MSSFPALTSDLTNSSVLTSATASSGPKSDGKTDASFSRSLADESTGLCKVMTELREKIDWCKPWQTDTPVALALEGCLKACEDRAAVLRWIAAEDAQLSRDHSELGWDGQPSTQDPRIAYEAYMATCERRKDKLTKSQTALEQKWKSMAELLSQ